MTQNIMLRAYRAAQGMEPIVLLDYYVKILVTGKGKIYGKIDFYESVPPFQVIDLTAAAPLGPLAAYTALAAATSSQKANLNYLELSKNEFGQWRYFPLDDMYVQLFNPAGVAKHQLRNLQIGVEQSIVYRDPLLVSTEFFTLEDNHAAVLGTNFGAIALATARIVAMGYRFHFIRLDKALPEDSAMIKKIENGDQPCTPIICSGYIGNEERVEY